MLSQDLAPVTFANRRSAEDEFADCAMVNSYLQTMLAYGTLAEVLRSIPECGTCLGHTHDLHNGQAEEHFCAFLQREWNGIRQTAPGAN
jgi:hypothetical protein